MSRLARIVVSGEPYHVIQRGNRNQRVFFYSEDKRIYLRILEFQSELFGLEVWAYCLMDNHVHLIVCPREEKSLVRAIAETHQMYTRMINFRQGWRGYLWQGRFKSILMEEKYLYAAVRYVEQNPVRVGMVLRAQDYEWSSARAHVYRRSERLLSRFFLLDEIVDWDAYLLEAESEQNLKLFRQHNRSSRPLGSLQYLKKIEVLTGKKFIK